MEMDIPSFQLLRWVKVLNPYSLLLGYYHHEKIKERWIQKIPQDKSNLADFPILSTPLSRNEGSSTGHHRPLHSFQEHFSLGSGSNFMSGDRAYTYVTSMRVPGHMQYHPNHGYQFIPASPFSSQSASIGSSSSSYRLDFLLLLLTIKPFPPLLLWRLP